MTKTETVKMFALIKSLFPRDEAFKNATMEHVDAWTEVLADIPFDAACAAIKATVSTSPFPPSIAEIRDYATRLNGPRRMTAEEAWGQACEVIRTYGTKTVLKEGAVEKPPEYTDVTVERRTYRCVTPQGNIRQYEAELHCDPEVWKLLKNMGYKQVVESDNPDVVRGQFMRAWQGHDTEAKEYRVIGSIVPELFGANGILRDLLTGGENGEEL
jgi:hypothetical protein